MSRDEIFVALSVAFGFIAWALDLAALYNIQHDLVLTFIALSAALCFGVVGFPYQAAFVQTVVVFRLCVLAWLSCLSINVIFGSYWGTWPSFAVNFFASVFAYLAGYFENKTEADQQISIVQPTEIFQPQQIYSMPERPGLPTFTLEDVFRKPVEPVFAATTTMNDNLEKQEVKPMFKFASDVNPQDVDWLWPGVIQRGAFNLISGAPGLGKSTIALDVAARVSRGIDFPDGARGVRGRVLVCEGEDNEESVTVPRLNAAGAHLNNVILGEVFDLSQDTGALDDYAYIDLIILSPIRMFFGSDSYNENQVRTRIAPLQEWAKRNRVAVLGVTHPPKGKEGYGGSQAWEAAARAGLFAEREGNRRILRPLKNNNGPDDWRLIYTIEGASANGIDTSRIQWLNGSPVFSNMKRSAKGEAMEWLRSQLQAGPAYADELKQAAAKIGINHGTLNNAANALGVLRIGGGANENGQYQSKQWRLP